MQSYFLQEAIGLELKNGTAFARKSNLLSRSAFGTTYGDSYDFFANAMPDAARLYRRSIWPGEKDYAANLGGRSL